LPFSCWGGVASQTGHAYKNNITVLTKKSEIHKYNKEPLKDNKKRRE
jgi:hypothetical protein